MDREINGWNEGVVLDVRSSLNAFQHVQYFKVFSCPQTCIECFLFFNFLSFLVPSHFIHSMSVSKGDVGAAIDIEESGVQNDDRPIPQSLRVIAKDVSDYYTKAEYTAFLKPKSGKEKKMRRKRKEEEIDPLEGLLEMSTNNEGTYPPPVFLCV